MSRPHERAPVLGQSAGGPSAIAAVHGIDYLITWNLKHIAHALVRRRIERVGREAGYEVPVLCTPEELMGEFSP